MSRDDPHFRLRIPADQKLNIEIAANESGRSVNAEILTRLEAYDDLIAVNQDFELAKSRIDELGKQVQSKDDLIKMLSEKLDEMTHSGRESLAFTKTAVEGLTEALKESRNANRALTTLVNTQFGLFDRIFNMIENIDPPVQEDVLKLVRMGRETIQGALVDIDLSDRASGITPPKG
ncbi:Arc family DNA-binding protein [Brucella tritici]|uniref:Arc family DNA-binding protein n=1 Tax=Brucella tritici TaxID=94626 RepID=UPI002000DF12|nr:Arc family DNA-binding protein [Brucella tritici]